MRHQQYKTVCIKCVTGGKEEERVNAMKKAAGEHVSDDEGPEGDYPDWGAVYLSAASRAIVVGWYRRAQERVYGKRGRKRRQNVVEDVSDDEGEDLKVPT